MLSNRRRDTYEILFTEIRNNIIARYQNLGAVHTMILDFEPAVHDAARAVLQVETRGCFYHFSQSLIRFYNRNGLMAAYEAEGSLLRQWTGVIKALVLLPIELVLPSWQNWLQNAPDLNDPILQHQLQRFVQYFQVGVVCLLTVIMVTSTKIIIYQIMPDYTLC